MAEVSIIPIRIDNEPGMAAVAEFLAERQETLHYPPKCIRLLAGVAIEGQREDGAYRPDEEGPIVGAFTMGLARSYKRDLADREVKPTLRVKIGRVVTGQRTVIETLTAIGDFAATHRLVALAEDKDLRIFNPDPLNLASIREARRMMVAPPEDELKLVRPKILVPPGRVGALNPAAEG